MNATNVKHEAPALNFSAAHQLLKASGSARLTAGEAPAREPMLADNVALKLRPFMAARPAKLEPNAA